MPAKLIFYESPKLGEETFNFCPLVKWGCKKCPFSGDCKGEDDEHIAFKLSRENGSWRLLPSNS